MKLFIIPLVILGGIGAFVASPYYNPSDKIVWADSDKQFYKQRAKAVPSPEPTEKKLGWEDLGYPPRGPDKVESALEAAAKATDAAVDEGNALENDDRAAEEARLDEIYSRIVPKLINLSDLHLKELWVLNRDLCLDLETFTDDEAMEPCAIWGTTTRILNDRGYKEYQVDSRH